ncbi:hypothetical protein NHX12_028951 [Muraenolepis orangiensis]|uniref:Uncharacterized protein n=1 Tax=Muraenolepis orangiensis TaxID=630683 RepID=A0A9Q0IN06_9TELE|nr:hypothetical protein NHX12_028951 [Muraenolepis orangiensis]
MFCSKQNVSDACSTVNSTRFYGMSVPRDLRSFQCYLTNASHLVPEVTETLLQIAQATQDLRQLRPAVAELDCVVPTLLRPSDYDSMQYVRCLLEVFAQWLKGCREQHVVTPQLIS